MSQRRNDSVFSGLRVPKAPDDLRERLLLEAGRALRAESAGRASLWERICTNRALRLAWVATTFVLLAAHVVLSLGTGDGRPLRRGTDRTYDQSKTVRELLALPTVDISPGAAAMSLEASSDATSEDEVES